MGWVEDKTGVDLNPVNILTSALTKVGDVIGGAMDIVSSSLSSIGNTVQGILKDPLPTVLQIGGAMIGIPPYVTAAVVTAARGGSFEDIAKSAAISYASSEFLSSTQIGADIREALVNTPAGDFTDMMIEQFDLPVDTAVSVARAATASLNNALVGGINSALTGKNVMEGITSGFTSGLIYSGTDSYFNELNKDPNWGFSPKALDLMKGAASTALNTIVSGKVDPAQAVGNYITYATLRLGSSEMYKSVTKAYEDFTGKTEAAEKAQDAYVGLKAKFDAEAGRYNTGLADLKTYQGDYQKIYDEEYTPITNQLNSYKSTFDQQKGIYDNAKASYDANKWAYENYDAKLAQMGYQADPDYGYYRIIGGKMELRFDGEGGQYWARVPDGTVLDAEGNATVSTRFDAPSRESFAAAANESATIANAASANATAASGSYTALSESEQTKDVISRLQAKEKSVTDTVATLTTIKKEIEAPSGDNLAARLKAASDKYQKEYDSYSTSKAAANRASENYTKIVAEIATRDATIDAINSGAIEVTGKGSDGSYQLSNGMTLKDGKFYQDDGPVFTNAAGISQNGLEFFDGSGNLVKFGSDLGRQLSTTDVQNIFKRDYGLTLTDTEAKQFSGASFANYDATKFQDAAMERITKEFESIANRKPTATEAANFLNQDDAVGAAQNSAINGLDLPDEYVSQEASQADRVSFGQAFAAARKDLGPGKTFQWTNENGETKTYTTDNKEEIAVKKEQEEVKAAVNQATGDFDSRDVSLVKGRLTEAIRMSNITGRVDDSNPADLTEKEMASFVDNYVKATPEQRAGLLRGADSATYKVINDYLQNYNGVAEKTSGQAYQPVFATGEIKNSNYTDYIGTVKTGIRAAGNDLVGLATRAGQVMGEVLGYDTPMLDKLQTLMTEDKEKRMNQLVGNERVVAGGIASGISSALSWTLGGPVGAVATLGGIAANNAWIEGSNAVIDSKGRTWNNADEAKANGVFTFTKLTPEQNGLRTAVMTSLEIAGEALGVPGMSKLMKGIPITGDVNAIVNAVKNFGIGLGNEQVSELLTTTAQMAADKYLSVGLGKNATFEDYVNALRDTAIATTAAVGTAGSASTALQNLRNAANTANPFSEDTRETSVTPSLPSLNQVYKSMGVQQYDIDQVAKGIQNTIKNGGVGIETIKDRASEMLQNLGATGARADALANEMVDRVLNVNLTNSLTAAGLNQDQIDAVINPIKSSLTNQVGPNVFRTQINEALANNGVDAAKFGEAVAGAVMSAANLPISPAAPTAPTAPAVAPTTTAPATAPTATAPETTTTTSTTPATQTVATETPLDPRVAMNIALGRAPMDLRYDIDKDGSVTPSDVLAIQKQQVGRSADPAAGVSQVTTGTDTGTSAGTVTGTDTGTSTSTGTGAATGTTTSTTTPAETTTPAMDPATQAAFDTLTAAQKADVLARVQMGENLESAIGDVAKSVTDLATSTKKSVEDLGTQITNLGETTKTAFDSLNAAQKAEVAARVQQGEDLESAIGTVSKSVTDLAASTEKAITGLGTQISDLSTATKTAFDNLSAAQKTEVENRVKMGENLETAIDTVSKSVTDLATSTQTAIEGVGQAVKDLGASTQTAFDNLSAAQKAEVAARVQQGQNLETAITSVATSVTDLATSTQQAVTGLGTQITDLGTQVANLGTATQTAFDNMSAAQKAEVNARVQMGQNLETAINTVQTNLTQTNQAIQTQLGDLSAQTQAQYDELNASQKAEVAARIQMGENLETAITTVGTQLGTELKDIKTEMASEKARQAAAQRSAQQKSQQQAMMAKAQSLIGRPSTGADETIPGPSFKDPFMTSGAPTTKFEGPLEQFLKTVKEGTYTQPGQPMQQTPQQTQQTQQAQQPQQPEQSYFSYGTANDIDAILNPLKGMGTTFTPYSLEAKEGGLASVLMAQGGTTGTRHGRYAAGGLNTVEHSGKMRVDFRKGDAVTGPGDGQSDDIPAMLADGEFVFPADVVAALGNGSTKAGSDKLYDMMHSIRSYHRSAKPEDLPPPAKKSPLDYLKDTKQKARR